MRSLVTVVASTILLSGCGDLGSIASSLDNKSEPTYWFWAELQGIEFGQIPEIQQMLESAKAASKEHDVDKTSQIYLSLGGKHNEIARQMGNLDSNDVDEEAVAFCNLLMQSHSNLATACNDFSQAGADRDSEKLETGKQALLKATANYVSAWNGRTSVMESLKKKYSRDFNVVH